MNDINRNLRHKSLTSFDQCSFLPEAKSTWTKFGEQAIIYPGPDAWNSLPNYLQTTINTNKFKCLLEKHLFTEAF